MGTSVISEEDMDKPIIRRKAISVHSDATMKAVVQTEEYGGFITDEPVRDGGTGAGPSPLQAVLGALCGCESVTFNRTAAEFDFAYDSIDFEAAFTIDIRGRMGVENVRPHFQTIRVQALVSTAETEERLREVVEETERRCPVFNLIQDAGVRTEMMWIRKSTSRD